MQVELARALFWLETGASVALIVREAIFGGPHLTATVAFLVGAVTLAVSYRRNAPVRALALALLCAMVLLITDAAGKLGGASGSALAFSFVPGFLAILVLGPGWGWGICGLMLAAMAWLFARTGFPGPLDRLRFIDEVAMAVFAAGLAHALVRSFAAYEAAIDARAATLRRRGEERQTVIQAIYLRLEPLTARLVEAVEGAAAAPPDRGALQALLRELFDKLREVKALCRPDAAEAEPAPTTDQTIRAGTMRVWLRMAALLMAFFVVRNLISHAPFAPSLFSIGSCLLVGHWLTRPASSRHMESTALGVGLLASGPMIVHIHAYGGTPDAPPLVVTPATVLLTALLSQGRAAFAVVALNVGILGWVALGGAPSLKQSRLLGDLGLSFVVVVIALRSVFALRRRYADALIEQGRSLAEAARQHRRLAGTLFHDVSNHLQMLGYYVEFDDLPQELRHAQSLSRRVQRLVSLSKEFLLPGRPQSPPHVESLRLGEAVESLQEAFGPRIAAKKLRFQLGPGLELRVRAQADLLIESVLGNLLSNAIKFSPPESTLTLRCEAVGSQVRIVLTDEGPGLPAEILRRLGDDGALPSTAGTDGEQGQGFGLHLAFEHIQRMGGRLEMRNREGGGAEATVWVPADAAVTAANPGAPEAAR